MQRMVEQGLINQFERKIMAELNMRVGQSAAKPILDISFIKINDLKQIFILMGFLIAISLCTFLIELLIFDYRMIKNYCALSYSKLKEIFHRARNYLENLRSESF